ncbi:STAS domain-containing protein [Nonomuraea sp. NPDC002799]
MPVHPRTDAFAEAAAQEVSPARLSVTDYHVDARIVVISVGGDLDMDTCPLLQAQLAQALDLYQPPRLVIEAGGLMIADSFGLTVLMAAHQYARSAGGRMLVCASGPLLRATFRRRGLDRLLDLRPTLAGSIQELRAP